jgi:hypothetical protein
MVISLFEPGSAVGFVKVKFLPLWAGGYTIFHPPDKMPGSGLALFR